MDTEELKRRAALVGALLERWEFLRKLRTAYDAGDKENGYNPMEECEAYNALIKEAQSLITDLNAWDGKESRLCREGEVWNLGEIDRLTNKEREQTKLLQIITNRMPLE